MQRKQQSTFLVIKVCVTPGCRVQQVEDWAYFRDRRCRETRDTLNSEQTWTGGRELFRRTLPLHPASITLSVLCTIPFYV